LRHFRTIVGAREGAVHVLRSSVCGSRGPCRASEQQAAGGWPSVALGWLQVWQCSYSHGPLLVPHPPPTTDRSSLRDLQLSE